MAGTFIRGALIELIPTVLIPIPNVVVFQYNPETMVHTWTAAEAATPSGTGAKTNPLAVKGVPGETFAFTIAMDAGDMIADGGPVGEALATVSGIYTRLAALEMLQYPIDPSGSTGLIGSVTAAISAGLGGAAPVQRSVPQSEVPTVLFVWGPGRIVPVRVTALTITEKLYDVLLNPTHAEAQLTLRVLTPDELEAVSGPMKSIAQAAYKYSQDLREVLAVANLGNAVESIIGMLPL